MTASVRRTALFPGQGSNHAEWAGPCCDAYPRGARHL